MKNLTTYIIEKLKISKSKKPSYNYFPKTKKELQDILKELIKERGNDGDFNDIDTSKITDMSNLFDGMPKFNGDISKWDVSNVTNMQSMFDYCKIFNKPLNDWDVSKVIDMTYMFCSCESFNQDISDWNVSNVKDMDFIFFNCPLEQKYVPKFKI